MFLHVVYSQIPLWIFVIADAANIHFMSQVFYTALKDIVIEMIQVEKKCTRPSLVKATVCWPQNIVSIYSLKGQYCKEQGRSMCLYYFLIWISCNAGMGNQKEKQPLNCGRDGTLFCKRYVLRQTTVIEAVRKRQLQVQPYQFSSWFYSPAKGMKNHTR